MSTPSGAAALLVFLVGYRCTGKTTIAKLLAARLGWKAVDADEILEVQNGRTIQQIFADEGEPGFRNREYAVLRELCWLECKVVATGGGVVIRPENRKRMKDAGVVVWLTADVDTICQRLQEDASSESRRPALTVGGRDEVEELLRTREPLYREVAQFVVNTAGRTPEEITEEMVSLLVSAGAVTPRRGKAIE
jgi:shikimate kinase